MVVATVVLLPLVVIVRLAFVVRAAWLLRDEDAAAVILGVACRHLPADRRDWGSAMLAELACIHGRAARIRFVVGGVRAAISARVVRRVAGQPFLIAVVTGIAACVALTTTALVDRPELRADPAIRPLLAAVAVVLAGYFALAAARSAGVDRAARLARRWSAVGGLAIGMCWCVFVVAWWDLHGLPLVAAAVLAAAIGAVAARSGRAVRVGTASVTMAGLTAGLVVFTVLMLDTLATAGGHDGEPGRHGLHSGAAYWTGEGLATSLALLVIVPVVTVMVGTLGAVAGAFGVSRQRLERRQ